MNASECGVPLVSASDISHKFTVAEMGQICQTDYRRNTDHIVIQLTALKTERPPKLMNINEPF